MIKELAEGEISSDPVHVAQPLTEPSTLFLKFSQITKTIGQEIPKDELIKILNALEIEIINVTEEGFSMRIPRYRVDVTRPADVIEEILRVYGYNNIASVNRMTTFYPAFHHKTQHGFNQTLANALVGQGFQEIINNSITTPAYAALSPQLSALKAVELLNPLGQELSQMRVSLLFSLLEVVAFNHNRQQRDLKLYELGKTYTQHEGGYQENKQLAIALCGRKEKNAGTVPQPRQISTPSKDKSIVCSSVLASKTTKLPKPLKIFLPMDWTSAHIKNRSYNWAK